MPLGEAAAPGTSVLKRHPSTAAALVPAWLRPVSISLSQYCTAVPAETSALPRGAPDGPNTFSRWRLLSALCPCPAVLAGTSGVPITGGWAAAPSPLLLSPDATLSPSATSCLCCFSSLIPHLAHRCFAQPGTKAALSFTVRDLCPNPHFCNCVNWSNCVVLLLLPCLCSVASVPPSGARAAGWGSPLALLPWGKPGAFRNVHISDAAFAFGSCLCKCM